MMSFGSPPYSEFESHQTILPAPLCDLSVSISAFQLFSIYPFMLLTYLDRMKPGHAFLGTTNLDVASLTERFQTRFQPVRLQPPENEALAAFLARRWGAPITITRQIAEGAKGNVRAAMADLEMWIG